MTDFMINFYGFLLIGIEIGSFSRNNFYTGLVLLLFYDVIFMGTLLEKSRIRLS